MTTALARRPIASATPTVDKYEQDLLAAAERIRQGRYPYPPLAEIAEAINEIKRALAVRLPVSEVQRQIGRLVLEFPQADQSSPEAAAVYLAALVEEASGYPPAAVAKACRTIRRTLKFRPSVAELVEACEAEMERPRQLLYEARQLEREATRRAAEQAERDQRAAEHLAERRRIRAALVERFGDVVPEWFQIKHAWTGRLGIPENTKSRMQMIGIEARSMGGDAVAFVQLRRASLFGLAREINRVSPRRLREAAVLDVAQLLADGDDLAARRIVAAADTEAESPAGERSPRWSDILYTMSRALNANCARRAAVAEGLIIDLDTTPREGEIPGFLKREVTT